MYIENFGSLLYVRNSMRCGAYDEPRTNELVVRTFEACPW